MCKKDRNTNIPYLVQYRTPEANTKGEEEVEEISFHAMRMWNQIFFDWQRRQKRQRGGCIISSFRMIFVLIILVILMVDINGVEGTFIVSPVSSSTTITAAPTTARIHTQTTTRTTATQLHVKTKWTSLMSPKGYRHDVTRYYSILGLQRNRELTIHHIKSAYRRLVKLYHPDANPNQTNRDTIMKFHQIKHAYDIVSTDYEQYQKIQRYTSHHELSFDE